MGPLSSSLGVEALQDELGDLPGLIADALVEPGHRSVRVEPDLDGFMIERTTGQDADLHEPLLGRHVVCVEHLDDLFERMEEPLTEVVLEDELGEQRIERVEGVIGHVEDGTPRGPT